MTKSANKKAKLETKAEGLLDAVDGEGVVQPGPVKRQRVTKPPVDIPEELLKNPERMNFVLLLAMLAKSKGTAEFTQKDLDIAEENYNVMFAKSLEGDKVVVSVVSVQSGILSAPTTRTKPEDQGPWPQPQLLRMPPPPPSERKAEFATDDMAALMAATSEPTPQERFLQQAEAEQRGAGTQSKVPQSFPFAVGDRPETSEPVDLGAWAKGETPKTLTLASEEAEAAARVEQQGY